eukprot:524378-Hanusia_phi.AAC.21
MDGNQAKLYTSAPPRRAPTEARAAAACPLKHTLHALSTKGTRKELAPPGEEEAFQHFPRHLYSITITSCSPQGKQCITHFQGQNPALNHFISSALSVALTLSLELLLNFVESNIVSISVTSNIVSVLHVLSISLSPRSLVSYSFAPQTSIAPLFTRVCSISLSRSTSNTGNYPTPSIHQTTNSLPLKYGFCTRLFMYPTTTLISNHPPIAPSRNYFSLPPQIQGPRFRPPPPHHCPCVELLITHPPGLASDEVKYHHPTPCKAVFTTLRTVTSVSQLSSGSPGVTPAGPRVSGLLTACSFNGSVVITSAAAPKKSSTQLDFLARAGPPPGRRQ